MKTGIELITEERKEQIEKHGRTVEHDIKQNSSYQLSIAASKLLAYPAGDDTYHQPPNRWNVDAYRKMREKTYKERLIIAGALLAAELDRLQATES